MIDQRYDNRVALLGKSHRQFPIVEIRGTPGMRPVDQMRNQEHVSLDREEA